MSHENKYFPVIESVSDSFGNSVVMDGQNFNNTHLALKVGTRLEIRCQGWAPSGQKLTWSLQIGYIALQPVQLAKGTEVSFSFDVKPEHIGNLQLVVTLASDSSYHLHDLWDDQAALLYLVLPPDS